MIDIDCGVSEHTKTFWELEQEYRIIIPAIQRDYVQGRNTDAVKMARTELLDDLYEHCNKRIPLSLNFIYGGIGGREDNRVFYPLDGQQRLTTLFLLHWFAILNSDSELNTHLDILNRFGYETRQTSRDFFLTMCKCEFVLDLRKYRHTHLSEFISQSGWFRPDWKYDPTVQSSLVILDELDLRFKEFPNLWDLLISDACPIYFEWLDVDTIGNVDDLYIKMNSRGKPLTGFESFKTELQSYIEDNIKDFDLDSFMLKIDSKWTDFFWRISKDKEDYDTRFMSFMHWMLWNRWCDLSSHDATFSGKENGNRIQDLQANNKDYFFSHYQTDLDSDKHLVDREYLDTLSLVLDYISSEKCHPTIYSIIERVTNPDQHITYDIRFRLQAVTSYLKGVNGKFNLESWSAWWRIMDSLSRFADHYQGFNTLGRFEGALHCITDMSPYANDILRAFADTSNPTGQCVPDEQVREEQLKARIIIDSRLQGNRAWEETIYYAEKVNYLEGRIGVLLSCVNMNEPQDSSHANDEGVLEKFIQFTELFSTIFGDSGLLCDGALFRRALMTKGDYGLGTIKVRRYIIDDDNKHRYDWRNLVRQIATDQHRFRRSCFVRLLEDLLAREGTIDERLTAIINAYTWDDKRSDWWCRIFLDNADLFDYIGNLRIVSPVAGRWQEPVCFLPVDGYTSKGRNRELRCLLMIKSLVANGWKYELYSVKGLYQGGKLCKISKGSLNLEIGLIDPSKVDSMGTYAIYNADEDKPLFICKDHTDMFRYISNMESQLLDTNVQEGDF